MPYGYAPYEEAATRGQARVGLMQRLGQILAGAGQGLAATPQNAGVLESLATGFAGSYGANQRAQQAAQEYAMKKIAAERQQQMDELNKQNILSQIEARAKPAPGPKVPGKQQDYQHLIKLGLSPAEARQTIYGLTLQEQTAQKTAAANLAGGGAPPPMDEPTLLMAALNYAKGGGLPPLGMSKASAEARMKIMAYAAHHFPNLDVAANRADLQKNIRALTDLQKLYDASTAFEGTAIANADVMIGTLKGIPDTGTRFGNRIGRFLASQAGSPEVSQFYTALETVKPEFARLLSSPGATGGLLTDTSRREMSAVLSGDFTKPQLIHSLNILKRDAANRRMAYSKQIDVIRARLAWNQSGANPNFNVGAQQPQGGIGQPSQGDIEWIMDPSGNLVPQGQ